MTSPSITEADGGGPTVDQAVGPLLSGLPYDPEWVFNEYPLPPDMSFALQPATTATYRFSTREDSRWVDNTLSFIRVPGSGPGVLVTDDIKTALRGDVDSVAYGERADQRSMLVSHPRPETNPEQLTELWRTHLATRDAVLQRYERACRQRLEDEANAKVKATEMLVRMLDPEQRKTFKNKKKRYFDVVGSHGTHYRIFTYSYSGNVRWLKGFPDRRFKGGVRYEPQGSYCGHCNPDGDGQWLPTHDHNLVQLLELRYNEIDWLNTAVRLSPRTNPYPPAWYRALSVGWAEKLAYEEKCEREQEPPARSGCFCTGCQRF